MFQKLSGFQILARAQRFGVRQVSVHNFLSSIDYAYEARVHFDNARRDAKMYRWNTETLDAILDGLRLAYPSFVE